MIQGQAAMSRRAKIPGWDGTVRGLGSEAVAVEFM